MGASVAATAIGVGVTAYSTKKKMPKERTFALAYFTLMEALQALSYLWIGQCTIPPNTTLTYLSLTHIAFQPLVMSLFMLTFTSDALRKKWLRPITIVSLAVAALYLIKIYVPVFWNVPQEWMCRSNDIFCSIKACTYQGTWHLAWRLPLVNIDPSHYSYFIVMFVLPILYGNWRISLYHFLIGPFLSWQLTTNHDESPAVWCLFSIGIVGSMFLTPLRKWLEIPKKHSKKSTKKY